MANLNGLVVLLMAMCLMVKFRYIVDGKIDARVDIVAMVSHPKTDKMLEAHKKIPTYFELGETKAQLGIVADVVPYVANIVLPLTYDEQAYLRKLNEQWQPTLAFDRTRAFFKIYGRMLPNRGLRAKVMVQTMGECIRIDHDILSHWENASRLLQASGVWLYVVTENIPEHLSHIIGYHLPVGRAFILPTSSSNFVDKMDEVRDAIRKDLCDSWDSGCRYIDATRQTCQFEEWLRLMNDPSQCSTTPPGQTETCPDTSACDRECDQRWPWDKTPDCTKSCGLHEARRSTSTPPLKMEHCALEYWCPPCTTTGPTTTTTTTTTTPTTMTTPTTTTKPTPSKGEPKDTVWTYILLGLFGLLVLILIAIIIILRKKRATAHTKASTAMISTTAVSYSTKKKATKPARMSTPSTRLGKKALWDEKLEWVPRPQLAPWPLLFRNGLSEESR